MENSKEYFCPKCGFKMDTETTFYGDDIYYSECYCQRCRTGYRVEEDFNEFLKVIEIYCYE